jgi:hypothetical protein
LAVGGSITITTDRIVHWTTRPLRRLPPAVLFRLRLRLSLQNTAELLTPILSLNLVHNSGDGQELPPANLNPDALAALAATYRDRRDGGLWTFAVQDGALAVERPGVPRAQLQHANGTKFSGKFARRDIVCEFSAQQDGQPRRVQVRFDADPSRTLEAITPTTPTAEELQAYAGKYHSPEIETTFTLLVEHGRLQLDAPGRPRQELHASIQNEFADQEGVLGGFVLRFERDAGNRVIGFRYNAPRVLKLRFDRQDDR